MVRIGGHVSKLLIEGMHGLGDNLHQRAIIRQLIPNYKMIWLETSWVSVYHDLIGENFQVILRKTSLRTQKKNAAREAELFSKVPLDRGANRMKFWYTPQQIRAKKSVLGAMMHNIPHTNIFNADFRFPIKPEWDQAALNLIESWNTGGKPIMIYRPLVDRHEWTGCKARNPDQAAYNQLLEIIRNRYFVVSIADLQPNLEWLTGVPVAADKTFHRGELPFDVLAALFARAALVFASPGFAVVLAQSVGAPIVCVFGGYERAYSFSAGAKFAPYLGIEPANPRDDFSHATTNLDKTIELAPAASRLENFSTVTLTNRQAIYVGSYPH